MNNRQIPLSFRRILQQAGRGSPFLLVLVLVAVLGAGGFWWWKVRAEKQAAPDAASAQGSATAASAANSAGAAANGPGGPGGPGGQRGRGGPGGNATQPVSVQKVRQQDIRITVSAIGSIAAANTAVVRAQVGGVLQKLNFAEGQQVRAGQVIAEIDPRAFMANLAQAEGALLRDTAQYNNAMLDLARYRDLLAKDAIPKQQFETQQALVAQLEGTAKVDQAAVATARLQLSYAHVTAPIPGRAGFKQADIGNIVQTSDPNGIVVITQTRPATLAFAVPAANVPVIMANLRANKTMQVRLFDRGGKRELATGTVATVDSAIDATTDTIKVKALFPNADDALFPNQAVSVSLQLDTLNNALAVPQAAVLRGAQGFFVYVVKPDNTVATRVVQPGAVDGDWMAVEGPLQAGETVVVDGVDRLRDGAKVEVVTPDKPRGPGGRNRGGKNAANGANSANSANGANSSTSPNSPNSARADAAAGESASAGPGPGPGSGPNVRRKPGAGQDAASRSPDKASAP